MVQRGQIPTQVQGTEPGVAALADRQVVEQHSGIEAYAIALRVRRERGRRRIRGILREEAPAGVIHRGQR